jgi:hypothetical protein
LEWGRFCSVEGQCWAIRNGKEERKKGDFAKILTVEENRILISI